MMLEFQLYNLAKQPQNWKLKYLMDHSKEPLSLVIKKINEKSDVVELFNKHSQYDHIINKYANENEVDPLLIKSIIYQESKFNTNARS
jgi:membrane-bound lytic murein transglycosylase MltF